MTKKKSIDQILRDMGESLKEAESFMKDDSDEGLKNMINHMMHNYVERKMVDACYNGALRNEFVGKMVKMLNDLYKKNVFDNEYKVIYKEVKP